MSRLHLVLGDWHIPYHDPRAVKIAYEAIKLYKPKSIQILGDFVDFYAVSDHLRDPDKRMGLQEEIDLAAETLAKIRSLAPKSRIYFHEGNHEDRLRRYMAREAPELSGLTSLRLTELLNLGKHGIIFRSAIQPIRLKDLLVTHGTLCRKSSAYTAKALVERYGCSALQGHTHRLGSYYITTYASTYFGWENGCLCLKTPTVSNAYTKGVPNWQQGFSVVHCDKRASVFPVSIFNGSAVLPETFKSVSG